jgi:predicted small secreted protein
MTKTELTVMTTLEIKGDWNNPNTDMTTLSKRIIVLLFVTALLAIVGIGCNTAHGFGKDMEKAGEKIQDGTK